jgi:ABC-2 type transport system permease protein
MGENTDGLSAVSPFHYYLGSDPLINGVNWGDAAVLLVIFLVGVALSVVAFDRRDLRG